MAKKNQNNIDGKFGLDVTDFKAGITQVNRDIREVRSEFNAASSGLDNWKESTEGVTLKLKSLDSILVSQKKKLQLLRDEYERVAKEEGETSKAAQNLKIRMNSQQTTVNKTEKELKQYKNTLDKVAREQAQASTATKKLNIDFEQLSKTASKVNAVGNGLTLGLTLPIVLGIKEIGKYALGLEATEAKFNTVFGAFRDNMQDYINDWQTLVPISEQAARSVASGIQDLLVPMGYYREDAQQMTESTMTIIGALTNFNNATHTAEQVSSAFQSAYTGVYKPMKALGVQTSVSEVKLKAVELGLAATTKEVTKQAQAAAFLKIAYEQSGDALAAFNYESLDTKSKLEISTNRLKDAGAELGTELIPMVIKGIDTINDLIDRFDELTPAGKKAILTAAGIAAATGPVIKGGAGIIKGFTSVNKLFKKFNARNVVSELGAVSKGAGLVSSGFGAIALPVTLGLAAVATGVLLWKDYLSDVKDTIDDTAVAASDFYSLMDGSNENGTNLKEVSEDVADINQGLTDIPNNIAIEIDSSSLDEARQIIADLQKEHANLLLAMGDEEEALSEYNSTVRELGDGLIDTKENALVDFMTGLDLTDLSIEERTALIREAKDELAAYKEEVNSAVEEITEFNEAVFTDGYITADQVTAYDNAIEILKKYGIAEEALIQNNRTLADTDAVLHQAMATGLTELGLFSEGVSDYSSILGNELAPVIDTVNNAMEVYSSNLDANSQKVLDNKAALEEQKNQQLEISEAYKSLLDPQVINVEGGTGTEFRDYIVGIAEGFDTLDEARVNASANWAENLKDQEQLAVAQLALGDYFSQYVTFMQEQMAGRDVTLTESLEVFREYLSEEDRLILEQSDALHNSYAKIIGYQETYAESAEDTQTKIDALDIESLLNQAEADAQQAAISTIVSALDDFEVVAGTSLPDAISTLVTAVSEGRLAMDQETEDFLVSLSTLVSEVEAKSSGISSKGIEDIVEPFSTTNEDGKKIVENLIAGMTSSFTEHESDLISSANGLSESLNDEINEYWDINSPSGKMEKKGMYLLDGLTIGMDKNAFKAYAKANEIAENITEIIQKAWDINSPSGVGIGLGQNLVSSISIGMEDMTGRLYQSMAQLTSGVVSQMQGITNSYATNNTYNRNLKVTWKAPENTSEAVSTVAFENKLRRAYG